ncbi:MAG: UvrD-helicase domain-containing protein [Phycisphaerales bacterium]|nr:UvrD-helicase domain-containing protein [Phycisphaerales bacterium]
MSEIPFENTNESPDDYAANMSNDEHSELPIDQIPDFMPPPEPEPPQADTPVGDPITDGLTPAQKQAVLHTQGPLLILAAAGSGKTRVITRRIAQIIKEGTPPWSILALTFTNKAAGEMRERVTVQICGPQPPEQRGPDGEIIKQRTDPRMRGLTITTFHSLCARLLRRYAERANIPGLKSDYTIYDSSDQMASMKRVLKDMGLQATNWPPRTVLSAISNAKNELQDAKDYEANAFDYYSKQIAKVYIKYEAKLKQAGAIDFDDLLLYTVKILETNPDICNELSSRWKYLLIDEYQDTNSVQFRLTSLLTTAPTPLPGMEHEKYSPNICVVGDPDQAIYGWRGADISNILDFEDHYPGAKTILLGENFRSTEYILAAADTLIKKNDKRRDKPLYTSTEGGEPITVIRVNDERHEGDLVTDYFQRLHDDDKIEWKDMAVFYRTNALSRIIEDSMRTAGIPYKIARGTAFFDREEIKTALSYLRVVANQADAVSLLRVVNKPTRGIGKTTLDVVQNAAIRANITLFEGLSRSKELGLSPRAVASVDKFITTINDWTGGGSFMGSSVASTLHELVENVITESGLEKHYKKQAKASGSESDEERLDNLSELITSARDFEREYDPANDPAYFEITDTRSTGVPPVSLSDPSLSKTTAETPVPPVQEHSTSLPPLLAMLRAYLESVALVADADAVDTTSGSVTLMTLHASKGLEFPAVAMIALEEGTLPHSRANESQAELEEERRLAFVGITRAMKYLQITSANRRTVRGMTERTIPSRFLSEIGSLGIIQSDHTDADFGASEYDDAFESGHGSGARSSSGSYRKGSFSQYSPSGSASGPGSARNKADLERIALAREQRLANVVPRPTIGSTRGTGVSPVSSPTPSSPDATAAFPQGSIVRHPQFGEGTVMKTTAGSNARVIIEFKSVGRKTLVLEYARLKRVR